MALFSTEKGGVHHISPYLFFLVVQLPQIPDDEEFEGYDKRQFWWDQ